MIRPLTSPIHSQPPNTVEKTSKSITPKGTKRLEVAHTNKTQLPVTRFVENTTTATLFVAITTTASSDDSSTGMKTPPNWLMVLLIILFY